MIAESTKRNSSPDSPFSSQSNTRVHRNLRALVAYAFFRGADASIYNVIWQPFALSLGASVPTIGVLASLGGWFGLVTNLVQPIGGWFADRIGRKPVMLIGVLVTIGAYLFFLLAGLTHFLPIFCVAVVALAIASLALPASQSMTAESARAEKQGTAFSAMTLATMLPGIVAPTLGGILADRLGYISVFPVLIGLEIIALGLVGRAIVETRAASRADLHREGLLGLLRRALAPPKGLRGFFIAIALDAFFWGMGWGLLYGMLKETYGFTTAQLGLMSSLMALAWAAPQLWIGRFLDRRGTRWMLIVSQAMGIPLILVWMTQTRFEIFALNQILFGVSAATWSPVVNLHLTRIVAENERAETFGRLNAFRGLIGFPSGAIGGALYAVGGLLLPLAVNLVGVVLIVIVLSFGVRDARSPAYPYPS